MADRVVDATLRDDLYSAAFAISFPGVVAALGHRETMARLLAIDAAVARRAASLTPVERAAFFKRLDVFSIKEALRVISAAAGRERRSDDEEDAADAPSASTDGHNDAAAAAPAASRRDAARIGLRDAACAKDAARARAATARVVDLLSAGRLCDTALCPHRAVVVDGRTVHCAACDRAAQVAAPVPSFSRFTLVTWRGASVAQALRPDVFVGRDGALVREVLPAPVDYVAACSSCSADRGLSASRWVADTWGRVAEVVVNSTAGSYEAAHATLLRCAERGCRAMKPAPARNVDTAHAHVRLSVHSLVATELLSVFERMNLALKYRLPAEAAHAFVTGALPTDVAAMPEAAFRACLYARYIGSAVDATVPLDVGVNCVACEISPAAGSVGAAPAESETAAGGDDGAAAPSPAAAATMSPAEGAADGFAAPADGVHDAGAAADESAGAAGADADAGAASTSTGGGASVLILGNSPTHVYVDANMKLFAYSGNGGGEGMGFGKSLTLSYALVAAVDAWWQSVVKSAPPEQGADARTCVCSTPTATAAFSASSERAKSLAKRAVTGHACTACNHRVFFRTVPLRRGENHAMHLIALLSLCYFGGVRFLFSDITCMLLRTLIRLSTHDDTFVLPLVGILWPGVFSAARLRVVTGANGAVFVHVALTRASGTVATTVSVSIDSLHAEGHVCAALYSALSTVGAGFGAPLIEQLFAALGPACSSFHNMAMSTHLTMVEASVRALNAAQNRVAVVTAARQLIKALSRAGDARKPLADALAAAGLVDTAETRAALARISDEARRAAAAPRAGRLVQPLSVVQADKLAAFSVAAGAALESVLGAGVSTRHRKDEDVPNDEIKKLLAQLAIPKVLRRPRVFSRREVRDLLAEWAAAAADAARAARPALAAAALSDADALRGYAAELRILHVQYHSLQADLGRNSSSARLYAQRAVLLKRAEAVLKPLQAVAAKSPVRAVKNFSWPESAGRFFDVVLHDALPAVLAGDGDDAAVAARVRASRMLQRLERRQEEVVMAFGVAARLAGNLRRTADALEAHAAAAAAALATPPADDAAFTPLLVLACFPRGAGADGVAPPAAPLAAPPPYLSAPHVLTPSTRAALQHLVSRYLDAARRLRDEAARAARLHEAAGLVPLGAVPVRDASRVYCTRFVRQLLAGECAPPDFVAKLVRGVDGGGAPPAAAGDAAAGESDSDADDSGSDGASDAGSGGGSGGDDDESILNLCDDEDDDGAGGGDGAGSGGGGAAGGGGDDGDDAGGGDDGGDAGGGGGGGGEAPASDASGRDDGRAAALASAAGDDGGPEEAALMAAAAARAAAKRARAAEGPRVTDGGPLLAWAPTVAVDTGGADYKAFIAAAAAYFVCCSSERAPLGSFFEGVRAEFLGGTAVRAASKDVNWFRSHTLAAHNNDVIKLEWDGAIDIVHIVKKK